MATFLLGMSLGIGLSVLPFNAPATTGIFCTYACLSAVNLYASYRALSSVHMRTLNNQRAYIVMQHYMQSRRCSETRTS